MRPGWRLGLILCGAAVVGCDVTAKSGSRAMPIELRSSADRTKPFVGVDQLPPVGEAGGIAGVGQTIGDLPVQLWDVITRDNLQAAINVQADNADLRREGLLTLASRSYSNREPYPALFEAKAKYDQDPLVRATATRIINARRIAASRPALVAALADGNPRVRTEAAKALANLPDPAAEVKLRQLLLNEAEAPAVRVAAADALRHFDSLETRRALIAQLADRNFAVAWQARRSLFLSTGEDFRYDQPAWLDFVSQPRS